MPKKIREIKTILPKAGFTYKRMKYAIVIQWSDEEQCFVVMLPEFKDVMQPVVTHGDTYEEALKNA